MMVTIFVLSTTLMMVHHYGVHAGKEDFLEEIGVLNVKY